MGKTYKVLGLMSGTSLDGIDVAYIETDGEKVLSTGASATYAYAPDMRDRMRACFGGVGALQQVSDEVTRLHAEAVKRFCRENAIDLATIDLVGFHGQTVHHEPKKGVTVQLGDGAALARELGVPVVNDFRTADVRAGGQGAPLVPLYHAALSHTLNKPVAILNIGGVANVTYLGVDGEIIAADTGPGNALLDDWMLRHTGKAYDASGTVALSGTADEAILKKYLAHPFFTAALPKSLDRQAFPLDYVDGLSVENGAATLAALTARAVAALVPQLAKAPQAWYVTGGGRHNAAMMHALQKALNAPVKPVEALGWQGDALEAQAFAFLAVRSILGLPLSLPTTTGVPKPITGGVLHTP